MLKLKNYLIKNVVAAELFSHWEKEKQALYKKQNKKTINLVFFIVLLVNSCVVNLQNVEAAQLSFFALTCNFDKFYAHFCTFFEKFTVYPIIARTIKIILYCFRNFGEAITIASLSILVIKMILFLGFNYQLNLYQYIILCVNMLIVDYKFNLYYYLRFYGTVLISKSCGEKMLEDNVQWIECNEEQDLLEQENDLADRYLTGYYIPKPNKEYAVEIPKETYINIISRNIMIGLVWLRLWMFAEPILFAIIKFCLVYNLIANNLIIITYMLSIIIIISRVLFYLTDRNNQQVQQTYQDLYGFTCVRNLQEELITETMKPKYKNAVIYMYCTIRDIKFQIQSIPSRRRRIGIIYTRLYNRLRNMNCIANAGALNIQYITFSEQHKYTVLFLYQLFSYYILFSSYFSTFSDFSDEIVSIMVQGTIMNTASNYKFMGVLNPNNFLQKQLLIKNPYFKKLMFHKHQIFTDSENNNLVVQNTQTTLNPNLSHPESNISPIYSINSHFQKQVVENYPCNLENKSEFLKQQPKYAFSNLGIHFDCSNNPNIFTELSLKCKIPNNQEIPNMTLEKVKSYNLMLELEKLYINYMLDTESISHLPKGIQQYIDAGILLNINGSYLDKLLIEDSIITILQLLIKNPELTIAEIKLYQQVTSDMQARQTNSEQHTFQLNSINPKFNHNIQYQANAHDILNQCDKIINALIKNSFQDFFYQYPDFQPVRDPKITNCYNKQTNNANDNSWDDTRDFSLEQEKIKQTNLKLNKKTLNPNNNLITTNPATPLITSNSTQQQIQITQSSGDHFYN